MSLSLFLIFHAVALKSTWGMNICPWPFHHCKTIAKEPEPAMCTNTRKLIAVFKLLTMYLDTEQFTGRH